MRRRLCTLHADVLARQVALDAVLKQVQPLRYLRPRPTGRRFVALFNALDLFEPGEVRPGNTRPLNLLVRVPWIRPLQTWRGGGLRSLFDHLLVGVRYPLPGFLWWILEPDRRLMVETERLRAIQLLALLGSGGSLRDAQKCGLIPRSFSKKANHALWLISDPQPVGQALRSAQVSAFGGPNWLGTALGATRHLALVRSDELWWSRVIHWLSDGAVHLAHHQVQPLVDYLHQQRNGQHVWVRQVTTVVRSMVEWHAELHARRAIYHHGPLPRSRFKGANLVFGEHRWTVHEIRTSHELVAEGAELHHCVATYQGWIVHGRSAIFSLRKEGVRRITVEVRLAEATIVQARGHGNRFPQGFEKVAIAQWAAKSGLRVVQY